MNITLQPSDAERLDAVLLSLRPSDALTLAPGGTFLTRGVWAFESRGLRSLPERCSVWAHGATVRFHPDAVRKTNGAVRRNRDLALFWCDPGCTIVGGTWDCSSPWADWYPSGLRFFGRFTLRQPTVAEAPGIGGRAVRVLGGSGSRSVGTESFLVSSEGATGGSVLDGIVASAKCADEDAYVTGIYPGATIRSTERTTVTGCDVTLGKFGQAAFSASGAPVDFRACTGIAPRWFYVDTGDTVDSSIENCTGTGSYAFASIVGTGPCRRELRISQCLMSGERAVEWYDTTPSADQMTGGVLVEDSEFEGHYLAAVAARRGSLLFRGFNPASEVAVVPGSTAPVILS